MQTFLDSVSKSTAKSYRRGLDLYCQFYGKSIDVILEERKADLTPKQGETMLDAKQGSTHFEKELEKYHQWLLSKGYAVNTCRTMCLGLLQCFRYYGMSLSIRAGSPISQTTIKIDSFPLTPEIVRRLFNTARDLRTKLIISLLTDMPMRISDLITLKRAELPDLSQPAPIEFTRIAQKEKTVQRSCLSETTVSLLKEYLTTYPTKENPYLFNVNSHSYLEDERVTERLRDLALEAKILLGNYKFTVHCFRKYIISEAQNLSLNPDIVGIMTGKAVNKSLLTYMTTVNIKQAFMKLQTATGLKLVGVVREDEKEEWLQDMQRQAAIIESVREAQKRIIDEIDGLGKDFKESINLLIQVSEKHKDPKLKAAIEKLEQIKLKKRHIVYPNEPAQDGNLNIQIDNKPPS